MDRSNMTVKEPNLDSVDYNNSRERTLQEMIDSKYDPENYFRAEGTE